MGILWKDSDNELLITDYCLWIMPMNHRLWEHIIIVKIVHHFDYVRKWIFTFQFFMVRRTFCHSRDCIKIHIVINWKSNSHYLQKSKSRAVSHDLWQCITLKRPQPITVLYNITIISIDSILWTLWHCFNNSIDKT